MSARQKNETCKTRRGSTKLSIFGVVYRGTSLSRNCTPLGPYRRPIPRVLGGSQGGGRFLMGEVPLYDEESGQLNARFFAQVTSPQKVSTSDCSVAQWATLCQNGSLCGGLTLAKQMAGSAALPLGKRETSFLATYWSESTLSSR